MMRKRAQAESSVPTNKKPRFPTPNGFTIHARPSPHPPQTRPAPKFRSHFTPSDSTSLNVPHAPFKQKQASKTRPLPVVKALFPNEIVPALASRRILSPPLPVLPSTKILEPPRLSSMPPRPSTPPTNLAAPDLSKFLSPVYPPPRPSKPVSNMRIARATDLWTQGGRADLLGLTLEQHGVQDATPFEKAIQRGLEVSPRKAGMGKEIRYVRGGLAEQASRAIGKKTTALSLWRKSSPSLESARMHVQIEDIFNAPKPPPERGTAGMLLCLARCRVREGDGSVLVVFSVPPHDAKSVAMPVLRVGGSVAIWEPFHQVEMSTSRVYLCTRFVL
ncbi:hypothetical protein F5148DRAFT_1165569, partial [Russula earlei]